VSESGNEDRANAATMQCGHRVELEPVEVICGAASLAHARCRVCSGVIWARCGAHGEGEAVVPAVAAGLTVARLRREHEEQCARTHGYCRACLAVEVDRSLGEELCPGCAASVGA